MIGQVVDVTFVGFFVVLWVRSNDRDVATACARPDRFPIAFALIGAYNAVVAIWDFVARDWIWFVGSITVAAMCARVLWHWWRRRRQGKPSRVLGLVTNMGHKLGVVAVPAPE